MVKIITATCASNDTLKNIFDELVNIGLPTEKIFTNKVELQIKIISGYSIESEILEVVHRHNPTETEIHELEKQATAKVLNATYNSTDTMKNVVDDLINNVGLPAEEVFADKKTKQVKVIAASAIEAEIKEVLNRHSPILDS